MYKKIIALAGLLAFSFTATGEQLSWYVLPIAGLAELKDGKPADGAVFNVQQLLESELPNLEHRYVASAANRVIHEMAIGTPLCTTLGPQIAERDQVGYFVPALPILPLHLAVRPEARENLPLVNGAVSFEQLIHRKDLRGVITPTRIYPTDLSNLISQAQNNGRILSIRSNSLGANLLTMVSYKRFDYTLEYPIVISKGNQSKETPFELIGVPIAEITHVGTSGFYCTRNSWGKDIARQLDSAIRKVASTPEPIIKMYRENNDQATFTHFEEQIRAFLKKRAETETKF